MTRSMKQNEQILAWAEEGLLAPDQISKLDAQAPLFPAAVQWRLLLERVAVTTGALLCGVGIIFFFAWNWAEMHRFAKFALGLGALTGFTLLAVFVQPRSVLYRAALLGCCLITGAILALIGQTYQTGADVWQLFAIWALLIVPWAWPSGSAACWGLAWAVGNLALVLFLLQNQWQGLFAGLHGYQAILLLAAGNGAVMLLFELFDRVLLAEPIRVLQRLAGWGVLTALGSGGAVAWWEAQYLPVLLAFGLIAAAMLVVYLRQRRDLPILAIVLLWLIVVGASALTRLTFEADETFLMINVVALFVLIASALSAVWLTRLSRESHG